MQNSQNVKKIVKTRFAPSPTGMLHIGGARTALFNWLYARKNNGEFYLRVEDTDKSRYSKESFDSIIHGLDWLGLSFDKELYLQSLHIDEHLKVAKILTDSGFAYFSEQEGVTRLKIPDSIVVSFTDTVYGKIEIKSSQIEDTVLVRSDGSPTFILSMSVDDYTMQITDVIRGSDHINNTLKQILIFRAMNWELPNFTHIPLIHNEKGEKLSKRDGALGILEYKNMGFLPIAVKNYLLRLGWSNKNHEIIDEKLSIELFDLSGIRTSPACFDISKLKFLNHHYINNINEKELIINLLPFIKKSLNDKEIEMIAKNICIFKPKSYTLLELAKHMNFYLFPIKINDLNNDHINLIKKIPMKELILELEKIDKWDKDFIDTCIKNFANVKLLHVKDLYVVLRLSILGLAESPSITMIMSSIDKMDLINRIKYFI